jgi:hypothetical protein
MNSIIIPGKYTFENFSLRSTGFFPASQKKKLPTIDAFIKKLLIGFNHERVYPEFCNYKTNDLC